MPEEDVLTRLSPSTECCFNPMPYTADIAEEMRMTEEVMTLWREVLPLRVLRLPYERLVTEQDVVSRALLEHCGLAWEPNVLNFHRTERTVQTASLAQACTTRHNVSNCDMQTLQVASIVSMLFALRKNC